MTSRVAPASIPSHDSVRSGFVGNFARRPARKAAAANTKEIILTVESIEDLRAIEAASDLTTPSNLTEEFQRAQNLEKKIDHVKPFLSLPCLAAAVTRFSVSNLDPFVALPKTVPSLYKQSMVKYCKMPPPVAHLWK